MFVAAVVTQSPFCIRIPDADAIVGVKLGSAAVGPLQEPDPDGQSQRGKGLLRAQALLVLAFAAIAALASKLAFRILHAQSKIQPRHLHVPLSVSIAELQQQGLLFLRAKWLHSPIHLAFTQAAADVVPKRHNKKAEGMYKFNFMWNEGPVNLIPWEHKDIYFHDNVVKASTPRQELPSSPGYTLPLCRHTQTILKPAPNLLLANRFLYILSLLSLWHKRMGINLSHKDI